MSALLLATAGLVPALTREMVRPTGPALLHARIRVHSGRASPPVLDLTDADLAPLLDGIRSDVAELTTRGVVAELDLEQFGAAGTVRGFRNADVFRIAMR